MNPMIALINHSRHRFVRGNRMTTTALEYGALEYGILKKTSLGFEEAVEAVTAALAD